MLSVRTGSPSLAQSPAKRQKVEGNDEDKKEMDEKAVSPSTTTAAGGGEGGAAAATAAAAVSQTTTDGDRDSTPAKAPDGGDSDSAARLEEATGENEEDEADEDEDAGELEEDLESEVDPMADADIIRAKWMLDGCASMDDIIQILEQAKQMWKWKWNLFNVGQGSLPEPLLSVA